MKKKNLLKEILEDREDICGLHLEIDEAQQEIQRAHDRLTHHVNDHRLNSAKVDPIINQHHQRLNAYEKRIIAIEQDNTRSYAVHHKEAFDAVYAKMKEQRGDYHDHIRQLVEENNAAHELIRKNSGVARECSNAQAREILKMQEQIKGLENRLSRAQDMIAEMHKDGYIPVKKSKGCTTCEFHFTPYNKEPCHSCDRTASNYSEKKKHVRQVIKPAKKGA